MLLMRKQRTFILYGRNMFDVNYPLVEDSLEISSLIFPIHAKQKEFTKLVVCFGHEWHF